MLPWIIMGALAAAAALWYLFRKKKKEDEPEAPPEPKPDAPAPGAAQEVTVPQKREPLTVREQNAAAIERIVKRLQFAVGQVIHKSVKVGEEMRPSLVPADDIEIRPMNGVEEIPRVLSSAHALDDDAFYAGVAAKQLPVVEHEERVDLLEDIVEPSRNIVVVIQDVSPSMQDNNRMGWAVELDKRIIAKAHAAKAEVALLPFGSDTGEWMFARTDAEREFLMHNLERRLYYIEGTDIGSALLQGINYLANPSFTERKIVLVTDGTTPFDAGYVKQRLTEVGVELHTVCIGPENPQLELISAHHDYLGDEV